MRPPADGGIMMPWRGRMSGFGTAIWNQFRVLLRIRKARRVPPRRARPAPGARIALGDLRFSMPAGMDNDLWRWLQDRGWREVRRRPDRRVYRDLPSSYVAQLVLCPSEERDTVLKAAIAEANARSSALSRR
jgi:hypothetical protein